jgi:hypothetical protein
MNAIETDPTNPAKPTNPINPAKPTNSANAAMPIASTTQLEPCNLLEPTALLEPSTPRELTTAPAPATPASTGLASTGSEFTGSVSAGVGFGGSDAVAEYLAQASPSAGRLDALADASLSGAGRLDVVVAWERLVRHAHAGLLRSLAALTRSAGRDGWLAESEVCAALAWSPSMAQFRLGEADALTRLFPDTLRQLSEGRVGVEQARSLAQLTCGLEDAAAQAVEARVLPRMVGQSVAVTRQAIRRAIVRADPDAAARRHRHERARRRVELRPEDDGMATLSFYLPADVAQMAMRTLTEIAHAAKRKSKDSGDKRTLDQRRADLLPVLLTQATGAGGAECAVSAVPEVAAGVSVVVGIETLLGLSHEPGHLQGYGPICPEQTRRIAHAHAARWRFLLTASDGTVVDASARTYTPAAAIKRLTELKRTTCAFPHCAMPAERCDLDHNQAFHKGGPTTVANLAPLCRRHHNGKSRGHWSLERDGDAIRWTSTHTAHSYTTTATHYQPTPTTGAIANTTTATEIGANIAVGATAAVGVMSVTGAATAGVGPVAN